MRYINILFFMMCLLTSACKGDKQTAIECVNDFIEAVWEENIDKGPKLSCIIPPFNYSFRDITHHYYNNYEYFIDNGIKMNPNEVSYCSEVVNVKEQLVKAKYKEKTMEFYVFFDNKGIKKVPLISATRGAFKFDNERFYKKIGFRLLFKSDCLDFIPYLDAAYVVDASRVMKTYLALNNLNDVYILTGEHKGTKGGCLDIEFKCSNGVIYTVSSPGGGGSWGYDYRISNKKEIKN